MTVQQLTKNHCKCLTVISISGSTTASMGGNSSLLVQVSQSRINMASANPGSFQPSQTSAFSASNPFSIQNILKPSEKNTHTRSRDAEDDTQLAAVSCPFKPVFPGQVIRPVAYFYRPRGLLSYTSMVRRHYGLAPHCMQPAIQMNHSPLIRNANPLGNGSFLPRDRHSSPRVSRQRSVFSPRQIQTLENEFLNCPYVTERKRAELASELSLTPTQVKTWFQNRRTKWKRKNKEEHETPLLERQKYCMDAYKHSWFAQTGFL